MSNVMEVISAKDPHGATARVRLKDGVQLDTLREPMWQVIYIASRVRRLLGESWLTVTDAVAPRSNPRSLHPEGLALDFRSSDLRDARKFAQVLAWALGPSYKVILETDHIHVEFVIRGPTDSAASP